MAILIIYNTVTPFLSVALETGRGMRVGADACAVLVSAVNIVNLLELIAATTEILNKMVAVNAMRVGKETIAPPKVGARAPAPIATTTELLPILAQ
jgi:hypothetical protein